MRCKICIRNLVQKLVCLEFASFKKDFLGTFTHEMYTHLGPPRRTNSAVLFSIVLGGRGVQTHVLQGSLSNNFKSEQVGKRGAIILDHLLFAASTNDRSDLKLLERGPCRSS